MEQVAGRAYTAVFYTSSNRVDWVEQATVPTTTDELDENVVPAVWHPMYNMQAKFAHPQYAKILKIVITSPTSFACVQRLKVDAVYKA